MLLNRRNLLQASSAPLLAAFAGKAQAQVGAASGDLHGAMVWKPVKIGGGGQATGFSFSKDGTLLVRTDSNGCFIWAGTEWQQLMESTRIPSSYYRAIAQGPVTRPFYNEGCYEVAVSPSDGNHIYMFYCQNLFKSIDKAKTFSQTAFPVQSRADLPGTGAQWRGPHIAVDPANPNVVYAASRKDICFSRDGGLSFTKLNPSPIATNSGSKNGYAIAFDATSGTTKVDGVTVTKTIYIASYGNALYQSTDGGVTFSPMAGSPTTYLQMLVSADGILWYVSDLSDVSGANINFYKCVGGVWTRFTSSVGRWVSGVSIDPKNNRRIAVCVSRSIYNISIDHGATWLGPYTTRLLATDIAWLAVTKVPYNNLNTYAIMFDPITADRVWLASGIGVWYMDLPRNNRGNLDIYEKTIGIENLCAASIAAPAGTHPMVGVLDRSIFTISDPDVYQKTCLVNEFTLQDAYDLTYASSDPTFIAGLLNSRFVTVNDNSGYSHDKGASWTQFSQKPKSFTLKTSAPSSAGDNVLHFATVPGNVFPSLGIDEVASRQNYVVDHVSGGDVHLTSKLSTKVDKDATIRFRSTGGMLAAASPSNIVIVPALNYPYPLYTLDGGATWKYAVVPNVANPTTPGWLQLDNSYPRTQPGWLSSFRTRRHVLTADRVHAGTFYLRNYASVAIKNCLLDSYGVYKSVDGGATWSRIFTGDISIRIEGVNEQLGSPPFSKGGYDTGGHLFYTGSNVFSGGADTFHFAVDSAPGRPGGTLAWSNVNAGDLKSIICFGFGKPAATNAYPTIFVVGKYKGIYGVWRGDGFKPSAQSATWTQIGPYPINSLQSITCISGDGDTYGKVYVGFAGGGVAYGTLT